MIKPTLVRKLPLFAASGLVSFDEIFYIIADDELSLLVTDKEGNDRFIRLWEHELPDEMKARKKVKPDLECLFRDGHVLYALPSFSRENRVKGIRIVLDQRGEYLSHEELDLSALYAKLSATIPDLNIEGAVKVSEGIILFQRGNGAVGTNALVSMSSLESDFKVTPIDLPSYQNVPLTFTDATFHDGKLWFLAVAEDSESTYLDGAVSGSFLGTLVNGKVETLREISLEGKPEGLCFVGRDLYLVTDDDSREIPSRLLIAKDS